MIKAKRKAGNELAYLCFLFTKQEEQQCPQTPVCLAIPGFLSLTITGSWGWVMVCCGGCPVQCTMASSIPARSQ
jgi:hypothetical protein